MPLYAIAILSRIWIAPSIDTLETISNVLLFMASVFCIAGFGFLLNDMFDIDGDARAGRASLANSFGRRRGWLLLLLLFVGAFIFMHSLPGADIANHLLLFEFLLFCLYSMPPFRLKERGLLGPIVDSLYGHVLPACVAWLVLSEPSSFESYRFNIPLLFLIIWQLPLGLRHILRHQIEDHESDMLAGEKTFAITFGPDRVATMITNFLVPVEAAGLCLFLLALLPFTLLSIACLIYLFIKVMLIHGSGGLNHPSPSSFPNALAGAHLPDTLLSPFFVNWFCLSLILGVTLCKPAAWPFVLILVLLSPVNTVSVIKSFASREATY